LDASTVLVNADDRSGMTIAEDEFHQAMVAGPSALKRLGYVPTRFIHMVADVGGVDAAHALLTGPSASDGFTTLWELGRLDMSVEATVLLPWYSEIFSEQELRAARRRLQDHRFDVEGFISLEANTPPSWYVK
jgi:hypothetical protein